MNPTIKTNTMELQDHFDRINIIQNPIYQIILRSGEKSIIKYYLENGRLKKNLRNLLSRLIVEAEKNKQLDIVFQQPGVTSVEKFKIDRDTFIKWSEDIEELFPSESKLVYYSPYKSFAVEVNNSDGTTLTKRKKINATGILYDHYCYLAGKLRKQDLLKPSEKIVVSNNPVDFTDEQGENSLDWLKNHLDPEDKVKLHWRISYKLRQAKLRSCTIPDYFEEFEILKNELGVILLSSDFNTRFPDREELFFNRWYDAKKFLINCLEDCKQLEGVDGALYSIMETLLPHQKDAMLIYLLPYLINPPAIRKQKGSKVEKLSITERREAFFIHAETAADIHVAIEKQRQVCTEENATLQPIPVIVGPIDNPDSYYVYINDSIENPTIYEVASVLHSIDLTFKIMWALNCSYTIKSKDLWVFIQKAFFNIHCDEDKCSRSTETIITTISKQTEINNQNLVPN